MDHASVTMPALHGEVKLSELVICLVFTQVKMHALRNQPVDDLATSANGEFDGGCMAEAGSCIECVLDMCLDGIPVM